MDTLETKARILAHKIRHLILSRLGRCIEGASDKEVFFALCRALKEEIMVHRIATVKTFEEKKVRKAYFLSMEYLPGRLLESMINSIGAEELVKKVLSLLKRKMNALFACEPDPGLGHGGLGRLSSCFLDSLATLHYPARAYGLRYQYGIFEQELWDGEQIERPDCWLMDSNPWESRCDHDATSVHFKGHLVPAVNTHGDPADFLENGEEVRATAYETPIVGYGPSSNYSVLTLRLWSTKESPRNFELQRYNAGFLDQAAENTSLTDILYPNDNTELGKRIRLKQEFLLVSASLQDIFRQFLKLHGDIAEFHDKVRIQINETHAALTIAELVRVLVKQFQVPWKKALEICQTVCGYTNHTILKEALEEWNEKRVRELLPRQYRIIQKLNQDFCDSLRNEFAKGEEAVRRLSIIEHGQIRMAHLAILGSHQVNGVAKLHTKILQKQIFPDFTDLFPNRFTNVTNGVTHRRWLLQINPLLSAFITKRIGSDWILNFEKIRDLASFASDPESQQEFLAIKKKNKEKLSSYLVQECAIRNKKGAVIGHLPILNSDALFSIQIKRFHEYKRQLLNVLHLIMVYQELLTDPNARAVPRVAIFAGKSAPNYQMAKHILHLAYAVCRRFQSDPNTKEKLNAVFLENYNVTKAEYLIPAADLSEQISTAGWEASGTGNMKFSMNGALTIGTWDGSNIEMEESVGAPFWPLAFGNRVEENHLPYNPKTIYQSHPAIRHAIDSLENGLFAQNHTERGIFAQIHHYLIKQDPFRVLQDLPAYYAAQKKAEELFMQPNAWAELAIHNIAGMAPFSTDISIRNYAEKIWGIQPCPPDPKQVAKAHEESFQCLLYNQN